MESIRIIFFSAAVILILYISRRPLLNPGTHGFFRFFVFEFYLCLLFINIPFWYREPASIPQIISWILLAISLYLIIESVRLLKKFGGKKERSENPENFDFENTVQIVKDDIYRYIRHPMYSSLLFLSAGTLLKNISVITLALMLLILIFLVLMAKTEEKENLRFFGSAYSEYMKETRMFVPLIF